ncbi:GFA family protein [Sulfitobacter sp. HNIBRBA3233]|uniref:GFA family protein n=1 Tax=Sulfitobacter marinivivus TaxID=3158558 RepID=UPI0032DFE52A
MTNHTGRCYCGEITYKITGAAQWQAQCHCRECQYISGGGPNYFMIVAADDFTITKGTPTQFARADLDSPRRRDFCPTCGTHLVTRLPDRPAVVVKVGTLDDPAAYAGPAAAIFTCDAQPYHRIPDDLPAFDKLPPR